MAGRNAIQASIEADLILLSREGDVVDAELAPIVASAKASISVVVMEAAGDKGKASKKAPDAVVDNVDAVGKKFDASEKEPVSCCNGLASNPTTDVVLPTAKDHPPPKDDPTDPTSANAQSEGFNVTIGAVDKPDLNGQTIAEILNLQTAVVTTNYVADVIETDGAAITLAAARIVVAIVDHVAIVTTEIDGAVVTLVTTATFEGTIAGKLTPTAPQQLRI